MTVYQSDSTKEYKKACCIYEYHIYQEIWEAVVGKLLICEREQQKDTDRYAVAVKNRIIGHLPSKVLCIYIYVCLFVVLCVCSLRRGLNIFTAQ